MERIIYKGFFIDKTKTGYRVSKQSDISVHSHLHNKNPCFVLIDNVVNKRIPKRCNLYYLQSHIRLTTDELYKQKLIDYYNVKQNKGKKDLYFNPNKKKFKSERMFKNG